MEYDKSPSLPFSFQFYKIENAYKTRLYTKWIGHVRNIFVLSPLIQCKRNCMNNWDVLLINLYENLSRYSCDSMKINCKLHEFADISKLISIAV